MGKTNKLKHVLVHGPQACGKTRNKDRLAAALGCAAIVDGEHWTQIKRQVRSATVKTLFLTCDPPTKGLAELVDVVPFHVAMNLSEIKPKGEE